MNSENLNTHKGIAPDNASMATRYLDDLIEYPNRDEMLLPSKDIDGVTRDAKVIYWQQVTDYEKRSPGYDERLASYRKLGFLLPSAPFVHLFWRVIDDYIDGDFPASQEEILELIHGVADSVKGVHPETKEKPEIMPLFEAGFRNWGTSPEEIQEVRELTLYGIKHMLEDPIRAGEGKILDRKEFDTALLHNTGVTTSLLYAALRIPWRAFSPDEEKVYGPAMEVSIRQAEMQHLRKDDLRKDWMGRLPNIRASVLYEAGLGPGSSFEDIYSNDHIRRFALEQAIAAERSFKALRKNSKSLALRHPKAPIVIYGMTRNFLKIKDEVQAQYGFTLDSQRV